MKEKERIGVGTEKKILGEFLEHGVLPYEPAVDDEGIDAIIRYENENRINYYEIQIKGLKDYNAWWKALKSIRKRILSPKNRNFILILVYRSTNEIYCFTQDMLRKHLQEKGVLYKEEKEDFPFTKEDRERYKDYNLKWLVDEVISKGKL
jgi:hypothetical protein